MKTAIKLLSVIMLCMCIQACTDDKVDEIEFSIDETNVTLSSGEQGSPGSPIPPMCG